MKKIGFMLIALLGFTAQAAVADVLGFANGRSANMDNLADMSVEAGATIGDYQTFGARVNYKVSPDLMVFGDLGMHDLDGFGGGMAFGAGAFYQLRNVQLLENTDFAVKGAYHTASVDFDLCNSCGDVDFSEITIEALISGDQLSTTNFGWYANAGIHMLDVSYSSTFGFGGGSDDTELGFGGGITGSIAAGEWYAGIDLIEEMVLRAGFRYNLN